MPSFKFWQFGCWNNLNTIGGIVQGRSNDVMSFVKNKIARASDPPDCLIIAGDNYYPHKIEEDTSKGEKSPKKEKSSKKEKETSKGEKSPKEKETSKGEKSPKEKETSKGEKSPKEEKSSKKDKSSKEETSPKDKSKKEKNTTKVKTIYTELLKNGLLSLPDSTKIYMILGNHDLDRNNKKNLFIDESRPTQGQISQLRPENNECEIIKGELAALKEKQNVDYLFFKSDLKNNDTLILMIDTSIYEPEKQTNVYLPCYNEFFKNNTLYKDKLLAFPTITNLRLYQRNRILQAISQATTGAKTIKHIIIVGHHPIYQVKYKVKEEEPIKFTSDIQVDFKPVLIAIYDKLFKIYKQLPKTKFYYLCSDLHLYQKGTINIRVSKETDVTMRIEQYIVGTGGTVLDPKLPEATQKNYINNEEGITYDIVDEQQSHGFLECIIDEKKEPTFQFIPFTELGGIKHNTRKKKKTKYINRHTKRQAKRQAKRHTNRQAKINAKRRTKKY